MFAAIPLRSLFDSSQPMNASRNLSANFVIGLGLGSRSAIDLNQCADI
jgi:hypothetical protein